MCACVRVCVCGGGGACCMRGERHFIDHVRSYVVVLIGQCLGGFSQPVLLNVASRLSCVGQRDVMRCDVIRCDVM